MSWAPREGYCCVIGCLNECIDHNAYCNDCWDELEDM